MSTTTPVLYDIPNIRSGDRWVRVRDLRYIYPRLCGEDLVKSGTQRCHWDGSVPIARTTCEPGPYELLISEKATRRHMPGARLGDDPDPIPRSGVHFFGDDTRPFLSSVVLSEVFDVDEMKLQELRQDGHRHSPEGALFGMLTTASSFTTCRTNEPRGYWFIEAGVVATRYPSLASRVHSTVCGGPLVAIQPPLPSYPVADRDGQYVPVVCLRRVCVEHDVQDITFPDEEATDIESMQKFPWSTSIEGETRISVERYTDNTLHVVGNGNKRGAMMVPLRRIRALVAGSKKPKREPMPRLQVILDSVAPGLPYLPIERSFPCTRDRSKSFISDSVKRTAKKSTNKFTIECRLTGDTRAQQREISRILCADVDNVSTASRYMSLLLNLDVLRRLDETDGNFPPGDEPDLSPTSAYNAMAFARNSNVPKQSKFPHLHTTCSHFSNILTSFKVDYRQGLTNAYSDQARTFVTDWLNSCKKDGPGRVKSIFIAKATLLGVMHKGLDSILEKHVSLGCPIPTNTHPQLRQTAEEYRRVYVSKGLTGDDAFDIDKVPDGQPTRIRTARILELFWRINRDLEAIEAEAIRTGRWKRAGSDHDTDRDLRIFDDEHRGEQNEAFWKRRTFSLFPVNGMAPRHIRIDTDVWTSGLFDRLHGLNVQGLERDMFESLFMNKDPDGNPLPKARRMDVRKLRSQEKGWLMGRSFTTDGISCQITYYNPSREATPHEKACAAGNVRAEEAFLPVEDGAARAGVDPGINNPMAVAWRTSDGSHHVRVLDNKSHRRRAHIEDVQTRRNARVEALAHAELASLSATRRKTANLQEFVEYVRAHNDGFAALKAAYGRRASSRERFEIYRHKVADLDRWMMQLKQDIIDSYSKTDPEFDPRKRVVLYWGNAKFKATYKGCYPAPTSRLTRRVRNAFKDHFDARDTDEYCTTKVCCGCHQPLRTGKRLKRKRDGSTEWREDRDVKWCTTPSCLGSHPFPPDATLLDDVHPDDKMSGHQPVHRDGSAAFNMITVGGKRNRDRPLPFRRPTRDEG